MSEATGDRTSNAMTLERMHDMLHADQSGLVAGLEEVLKAVKGWRWVLDGRGCFEWDDERYREEFGHFLRAVDKAASEAVDRWKLWKRPCCALSGASPSGAPDSAPKRAYYETHEPPHCPTCGCGSAVETSAEFEGCHFVGGPPLPFTDWNSWAASAPRRGVTIRASEKASGELT